MTLSLTYAQALKRYPVHVKQILTDIRASKSKHNKTKPEALDWNYDWCVLITESGSLEHVLKKSVKPRGSLEAQLQDQLRRTSVWLEASKAGLRRSQKLDAVPDAIREQYRKEIEEDIAEQARVDALSPAENQREIEALLGQLRGPGFMEFPVSRVRRR